MLRASKLLLVVLMFLSPISLLAQKEQEKKADDGKKPMTLLCPFEHGSGRAPKEAFSWDPPDHKVVMISQVDSVIRSCVPGEVVNVQPNEDGKYEVVVFYKDHYFWYNNVDKPSVKRMQKVTLGQELGKYKFGDELELRVYKEPKRNEPEMVDPRSWLDCKIPD